jgi:hypothetical protein
MIYKVINTTPRMTIKTIDFFNSTIFPIFIEGWTRTHTHEQIVYPNETCKISSETGEWYIHKMFCSDHKEAKEFWKSMGYDKLDNYLGKFRSEPCYRGDYSWMNINEFNAIYDNGMIIFVMN